MLSIGQQSWQKAAGRMKQSGMADSWQRQRLLSGITGDARFISANIAEGEGPALVATVPFFLFFFFLPKPACRNLPDWSNALITGGSV